jgi:regulator of replication initiation timing
MQTEIQKKHDELEKIHAEFTKLKKKLNIKEAALDEAQDVIEMLNEKTRQTVCVKDYSALRQYAENAVQMFKRVKVENEKLRAKLARKQEDLTKKEAEEADADQKEADAIEKESLKIEEARNLALINRRKQQEAAVLRQREVQQAEWQAAQAKRRQEEAAAAKLRRDKAARVQESTRLQETSVLGVEHNTPVSSNHLSGLEVLPKGFI